MTGKIVKIDPIKMSRNNDVAFRRVYFELQDGSWAATDLVSTFRNYARWKPIVEAGVGTIIDGLRLKGKDKIDADSEVRVIQEKLV